MKQKATSLELAEAIKRRINIGGVHLVVRKIPHGFSANVVTAPREVPRCQTYVNQIVEELCKEYELQD
jgi:hypothetical protein